MKTVTTLAATLVVLALATLALKLAVPRLARHLTWFPERLSREEAEPGRWGLARGRSLVIKAEDGVALNAWWVPPPAREPSGRAVLYLHGNGGHMPARAGVIDALSRAAGGTAVLALEYRGYGASDGSPSEPGLRRDARAAWRWLREEAGLAPGRIALFGESLGSAVAVWLASEVEVGAVILVGALPGTIPVARAHYPLPDWILTWESPRFDALGRIGEVDAPLLFLHGEADTVIPIELGRRVYDAAPEPRSWVALPGRGHMDLYDDPVFWREVDAFLTDVFGESD